MEQPGVERGAGKTDAHDGVLVGIGSQLQSLRKGPEIVRPAKELGPNELQMLSKGGGGRTTKIKGATWEEESSN